MDSHVGMLLTGEDRKTRRKILNILNVTAVRNAVRILSPK
jgi:hypothetical protein